VKLPVPVVPLKGHTHYPAKKWIVAELSDLGGVTLEPLYDDACDVGIDLLNPNTGNISRWCLSRYDSADGDLLAIILVPTMETVRKNPQLEGYELHLLND